MISIIIRTKNEERWITGILKKLNEQDHKDFEIIIVDNNSTDRTIEKAKKFDTQIVSIDDYLPGKALNVGVEKSKGEFFVCVSAHCVPTNSSWLSNLIRNFDDPDVAGVYGRQEPMKHSSDFDKRDLLITFGLDRRVQIKDSFFHNANSMIRRSFWEKIPFDDKVTNIEDRIWAKEIISKGFKIIYDPEASVYHHHGIHQSMDTARCSNIVKILESMNFLDRDNFLQPSQQNIISLIPMRGMGGSLLNKNLIEYTISDSLNSAHIDETFVLTDDKSISSLSKKIGAKIPFLRDKKFSHENVKLEEVLKYSINKLESMEIYPDLVVILQPTFPFRPSGLIDRLIEQLLSQGLDTVFPAMNHYGSLWGGSPNSLTRLDDGDIPRNVKVPSFIGIPGLACVTHPNYLRDCVLYGDKVGIFELNNELSNFEVRETSDFKMAEPLFEYWLNSKNNEIS